VLIVVDMKCCSVKNGIYYFRRKIPLEIRQFYGGQGEIIESLYTRDELAAKNKIEKRRRETSKDFSDFRKRLPSQLQPNARVKTLSNKKLHSQGKAFDKFRDNVDDAVARTKKLWVPDVTDKNEPILRAPTKQTLLEFIKNRLDGLEKLLDITLYKNFEILQKFTVDYLCDGQNILEICEGIAGKQLYPDLSFPESIGQAVIAYLIKAYTELRRSVSDALSLMPEKYERQEYVAEITQEKYSSKFARLSEVLDACLAFKERGKKAREKLQTSIELLIEWAGDRLIDEYTQKDMIDFIDRCLAKLPPNRKKVYPWREMSLVEVLAEDDDLKDLISPQTARNIFSGIITVFHFAHTIQIPRLEMNPTNGLRSKIKLLDDNTSRAYSLEEVKKMLSHLTYDAQNPARYFVVLLGLFTGARLNELCQLHVSDVKNENGIWYIDINENDKKNTKKRLKNKPSARKIPLHRELININIGFLSYTQHRKNNLKSNDGLLFPELTYDEAAGYARKISRWFNKTLKPKFKSPKNKYEIGFHSLRHLFIQQAQNQAQMGDRARMDIAGHGYSGASKVHLQYAGKLPVDRLHVEMEKLDYGIPLPKRFKPSEAVDALAGD